MVAISDRTTLLNGEVRMVFYCGDDFSVAGTAPFYTTTVVLSCRLVLRPASGPSVSGANVLMHCLVCTSSLNQRGRKGVA